MHAFKSYSNQKFSILSYCKMIYMYQTEIGTFHSLCVAEARRRGGVPPAPASCPSSKNLDEDFQNCRTAWVTQPLRPRQ